jgi:F0F1-type ATP synthase membrane subunit b/b'
MRGEYDVVEDIRIKKSKSFFNQKFTRIILVILIFFILCGLCFNLVYLLSFNNIEKNNDDISTNNKNNSRRIFNIEQKLRKDLEKMYPKISTK